MPHWDDLRAYPGYFFAPDPGFHDIDFLTKIWYAGTIGCRPTQSLPTRRDRSRAQQEVAGPTMPWEELPLGLSSSMVQNATGTSGQVTPHAHGRDLTLGLMRRIRRLRHLHTHGARRAERHGADQELVDGDVPHAKPDDWRAAVLRAAAEQPGKRHVHLVVAHWDAQLLPVHGRPRFHQVCLGELHQGGWLP
ncbi:unnamed protein product [Mycena citricolor]|uniref:Uncharacterized protein n=1 Tax=Mycena citricolor TaxID=2018698 RepID=A0AAD2K3A4_9AGAR|nr:unnamed protein product [Mycena citricolor]